MRHNYTVRSLSALGLVVQVLLVAANPILDSRIDPTLGHSIDSNIGSLLDSILGPIDTIKCASIGNSVCEEEEERHRSPRLAYFKQELPIPPVARPSNGMDGDGEPFYEMNLENIKHNFHPDLPATNMWGFNGIHPGPTLEVETGKPVKVDWNNRLSTVHPLEYAIDPTLDNGEVGELPAVRAVIHNHGAHVLNTSDGLPHDWITPGNTLHYRYPNHGGATNWYHDHTHGITRLNVYAGLAGFYLIRTPGVAEELGLPTGKYDIPLLLQDKFFNKDGSLHYPTTGHGQFPIWVSDMEADTPVLNGKVAPFLRVEPRKYRFRLLNGATYRQWSLYFQEDNLNITQIGSDGGFLPAPVVVREVPLGAAERADVVVDFSGFEGRSIILRNNAGAHESDAADLPELMRFDVLRHAKSQDLTPIPSQLPFTPIPPCIHRYRTLTLSEENQTYLINSRPFSAPLEIRPVVNTTEIWRIINLSDETHPIHVHLGEFKLIKRCPFDTERWVRDGKPDNIEPYIQGPCGHHHGVRPGETGHKDVFLHFAHTVTIVKMPFNTYTGMYVMHCHKLEHEDNDMMRPVEVIEGDIPQCVDFVED
ncbi:hypothetical protein ACN38_g4067 [Penicillium nordicum]|uniref:Multicopper oxidase n=1 Tax=Penicillium nordicum TaxID=229535 RepID=A0A0M9WHF2_9EURO|nr:hypothetical protein ACN38_g4067 [Penicillium nordicum]